MIGKEPSRLTREAPKPGPIALEVTALNVAKPDQFGVALRDVAFAVHAGEIVGIAGVSGNGQAELMASISGEDTRAPRNSLKLFGADIAGYSPRQRRAAGLHFVPEERLGRGAVPTLTLSENTLLTRTGTLGAFGWLRLGQIRALAQSLIERFKVSAKGPESAAKSLSGGNLQKFIVGRELDAQPKLLVVSQPTWGVDVGAAAAIRGELLQMRDNGSAVLIVSEELDELFEISDRLFVMARGRLSPGVPVAEASVEQIGEWMSGLWPAAGADASSQAEAAHA
jgi:simple sugar transport system ATP-binding protein